MLSHSIVHIEDVCDINAEITGQNNLLIDFSKLDSAVNAPFQSWGGHFLYPTLVERAAALLFFLCNAHAFLDGNKRTSFLTTVAYLKDNGRGIDLSPFEARDLALQATSVRSVEDFFDTSLSFIEERVYYIQ